MRSGWRVLGTAVLGWDSWVRRRSRLATTFKDLTKMAPSRRSRNCGEDDEFACVEYLTKLSDKSGSRLLGRQRRRKRSIGHCQDAAALGSRMCTRRSGNCGAAGGAALPMRSLLSPTRHKLHVDAMGWTGSTCERRGRRNRSSEFARPRSGNERHLAATKAKSCWSSPRAAEESLDLIFAEFGDFLRAAHKAGRWPSSAGRVLESQRYESDAYGISDSTPTSPSRSFP